MNITLNNENIEVVIERKNNKNIYFRFKESKLYVTCNKFVTESYLEDLILKNEFSLIKMMNKVKKSEENNLIFTYLGKPYTIVIDGNVKTTYVEDSLIFTKSYTDLDKFLKKQAFIYFQERLDKIKSLMNFVPEFTLKVRSMKTRWGVCNKSKKIVTLNLELIKKNPALIDYVIVHELCHFKYPHHQTSFWEEVAKYYPNYKTARKMLKE